MQNTTDLPEVGITFSTFDLLHPGHLAMLAEAKTYCKKLIVCLQSDPTLDRPDSKNKPLQTLYERYLQLQSCKYVDDIIPYSHENDIIGILATVEPDVRILGEEYCDVNFTGKEYCEKNGINIVYNSRSHGWSTTELRKRAQHASI